ncbi:MAG: glycosyltransferase family 39 protein [Scytolyngbya sp. HA4215-MV1]|jgi:uncharacterized membrane protein|nr:glycosyltransferase family 39 protein [Scytolyngbya sp. HA4215-MV1]
MQVIKIFMLKNQTMQDWLKIPLWLKTLIVLSILLGIFFRFYNLELKVYSFDETFTSTYMYGQHTKAFNNFDGAVLSVSDIQKYLFIDPDKSLIQSIQQVLSKIYVFPPLYPVLGLIWSYLFSFFSHDSLTIQRSFSAFLSLLSLVGIYWLGIELFESKISASVAVAIAAISPFHLQYAQVIRPYSILIAATAFSSACLLRAIHKKIKIWWIFYALSVALGLYANVLFGFVLVAHTGYLFITEKFRITERLIAYLTSVGIGTLVFMPWFVTFLTANALEYSVDQVSERESWMGLIKAWSRAIQGVFVDVYNPWFSSNLFRVFQAALAPIVLTIVAVSIYRLCRETSGKIRTFLLALAIASGVSLMLKDLIMGSAITTRLRYLIPFVLSTELMVAYYIGRLLSTKQTFSRKVGQFALSILIIGGMASCLIISQARSWTAFGSPHFPKTADIIRQANHPLVVVTHLDRAFSMSYLVDKDTSFKLLQKTTTIPESFSTIFLLEPSTDIFDKLKEKYKIKTIDEKGELFQVKPLNRI